MTTTVRKLITGSLRLLNYVQVGEVPTSDDMSVALQALDGMIDSWSNDKLMVYNITESVFNTVAGKQSYLLGPGAGISATTPNVVGTGYIPGTYNNVPIQGGTGFNAFASILVNSAGFPSVLSVYALPASLDNNLPMFGYTVGDVVTVNSSDIGGSGTGFSVTVSVVTPGDWNIIRPTRIEQMYVIWNSSAQTVDIPMTGLNDSQWAAIAVKQTPSTFPFNFYDDCNWPIRTIQVWPIPSVATPLRVWLREPLIDLTNLDQTVQFPPAYERAFRYNLAVELAAEFGKTISPEIQQIAVDSRLAIARINAVPQYSIADGGLNSSRRPFNYITGGFTATQWG